jgi:predicted transcriptional regulator
MNNLTKNEAIVLLYIALVNGTVSQKVEIKDIAQNTGIIKQNIYRALEGLRQKGAIDYNKKTKKTAIKAAFFGELFNRSILKIDNCKHKENNDLQKQISTLSDILSKINENGAQILKIDNCKHKENNDLQKQNGGLSEGAFISGENGDLYKIENGSILKIDNCKLNKNSDLEKQNGGLSEKNAEISKIDNYKLKENNDLQKQNSGFNEETPTILNIYKSTNNNIVEKSEPETLPEIIRRKKKKTARDFIEYFSFKCNESEIDFIEKKQYYKNLKDLNAKLEKMNIDLLEIIDFYFSAGYNEKFQWTTRAKTPGNLTFFINDILHTKKTLGE